MGEPLISLPDDSEPHETVQLPSGLIVTDTRDVRHIRELQVVKARTTEPDSLLSALTQVRASSPERERLIAERDAAYHERDAACRERDVAVKQRSFAHGQVKHMLDEKDREREARKRAKSKLQMKPLGLLIRELWQQRGIKVSPQLARYWCEKNKFSCEKRDGNHWHAVQHEFNRYAEGFSQKQAGRLTAASQ